jgi:predicted ATPase
MTRRLPLLTGGARDAPDRQRTLRDTIAWSYDILTADDQVLFRRLGVFAGGATFAAIETVVPASASGLDTLDGLVSLVDKSLVREIDDPDGTPRFSMLDTIREFALDQLDAAEECAPLQETHARWYLNSIVDGATEFQPRRENSWYQQIDLDLDNIRSALAWSIDRPDPELALQLCGRLWLYWYRRGLYSEARR